MTAAPIVGNQLVELNPRELLDSPLQYRKRDAEKGLEDLTASVREKGVLQPLCVRPHPKKRDKFELVYGHRRKRAAVGAELELVPCIIRELDDDQVVEAQLVENLDREDPHPLDEADGFQALVKRGYNAQRIAEKIGRPVAYVAQRLKLCDLSPKVREALDEEEITIGVAVLIAKLPGAKIQEQALEECTRGGMFDGVMSVADAKKAIEANVMLVLGSAPFDRGDATLVPAAGACTVCPKRTGNQAELFADAASKDLCTDPTCYRSKLDVLWQIRSKQHKAAGGEILNQKDAKALLGTSYSSDRYELRRQYKQLGDKEWIGGKSRTIKSLFGKELPPIILARDPDSGLPVELVAAKDAEAALRKARGESAAAERSKNTPPAAEKRKREEDRRKGEIRRAAVGAVVAGVEEHCGSSKDVSTVHRELALALMMGAAESAWSDTLRRAADRRQLPAGSKRGNTMRGPHFERLRAWATAKDRTGPELIGLLAELTLFRDYESTGGDTAYKRALVALDLDQKKIAAAVVAKKAEAKASGAAASKKGKAAAGKPKPARGKEAKAAAKRARPTRMADRVGGLDDAGEDLDE